MDPYYGPPKQHILKFACLDQEMSDAMYNSLRNNLGNIVSWFDAFKIRDATKACADLVDPKAFFSWHFFEDMESVEIKLR